LAETWDDIFWDGNLTRPRKKLVVNEGSSVATGNGEFVPVRKEVEKQGHRINVDEIRNFGHESLKILGDWQKLELSGQSVERTVPLDETWSDI
jgi:hypothetical protein